MAFQSLHDSPPLEPVGPDSPVSKHRWRLNAQCFKIMSFGRQHKVLGPSSVRSVGPQLRAVRHFRAACRPSSSRASSSEPCATHPVRRVPRFQDRTPNINYCLAASLTVCVGPRQCVGPSALCVGRGCSLCRGPGLYVPGPGDSCVRRGRVVSGPDAASCSAYKSGQHCRYVSWKLHFRILALIILLQIFVANLSGLCRALAFSVSGLAHSVSNPGALCVGSGALCVGPWRSVSGPALSVSLSVSGPGALCVRLRRSACVSVCMCVGPRRSVCRVPGLSVSGPGAFCVGARRSQALSVSGPDALCVGPRRSLYRCALSVGPLRSLVRAPAPSVSGPGALMSGPGAHVQLTNVYNIASMCLCY